MSQHKVTGTLASAAATPSIEIHQGGNVVAWGTFVATLVFECSYDLGVTWLPVSKNTSGDAATFTAPFNLSFDEPERDVLFRLRASAYTSGTINYRISGDLL